MRKAIVVVLGLFLLTGTAFAAPAGNLSLLPYMQLDGPPALPSKAPAPQVGDTHTFWAWDMTVMPPQDVQIDATCRGVSDNGYVFVEDAQWNVAMDQTDVDAILAAWDEQTPPSSIDPDAGIYDVETSLFGMPPNVDGWPGAVLLYYELGCFMGQCFDGFYRYTDQLDVAFSNQMDMIHLEAVESDPGSEYMLGVTAHEFNHMLQMVHDEIDDSWLSEALAEAAMVVTGYPTDIGWLADFVADPTVTFFGDEPQVHYGAALLLGTYLYEVGGAELLQAVTADSADGVNSLDQQLIELDICPSFDAFFGDMAVATAADSFVDEGATDADGRFNFTLLEVGELAWDDQIDDTATTFTWDVSLDGGSLNALRIDLTDGSTAVELTLDGDALEGAIVAAGEALTVTRFATAKADVTAVVAGADTALIVLANPSFGSADTTVTISFSDEPTDDDVTDDDDATDDDATDDDVTDDDVTDDDVTDDDATDDDATDDDDDMSAGDDDDDDSGCGC